MSRVSTPRRSVTTEDGLEMGSMGFSVASGRTGSENSQEGSRVIHYAVNGDEMGLEAGEGEALLPLTTADHTTLEIDQWALGCLLLQHLSNTFNAGLYDFAIFLFLIEVYRDTLIPASLVGLVSTLSGLLFSGYVGGLVDRIPRLRFVRWAIGSEKTFNACNYALFMILFGPLRDTAQSAFHANAPWLQVAAVWLILGLTISFSSLIKLANTGLTVAVERDWVTTIADGHPTHLTMLNTYMRRIDLFSKLCAPLFVSLLTTAFGYSITTFVLLAMSFASFLAEFLWTEVVFKRFPVLLEDEQKRGRARVESSDQNEGGLSEGDPGAEHNEVNGVTKLSLRNLSDWARREKNDWVEFSKLPIFCSSISIATIYLTTLSYDGTFIAYIKAARGWDDAFIAIMRGVCVITGMIGTWVMPKLEAKIGLERAGAWSIWFEIGCLLPVLISFFVGAGSYGEHGPAWNSVVLFGGIALSRIGLWSFDLCQLKELQLELNHHPRRNRLTALQISLQNLFDLLKYVVTLSASTPREFKWTALVSFIALIAGGMSYAVYLRTVRGHLLHLDWFRKAC